MSNSTDQQRAEPAAKPRGRRPGGADTKDALVRAAWAVFTEQGYDRATVRSIAARAGVDAAMVNHWFGGKEGLFTAAISSPLNPAEVIKDLLEGDPDEMAEKTVHQFLTSWDQAGGGEFMALIRGLSTHAESVRMLREFLTTALFGKLTQAINAERPDFRAALCGSQIVGLGMMRYVVRVEPLASADHDSVAAAVAPTLQRYLTGDLSGTERP